MASTSTAVCHQGARPRGEEGCTVTSDAVCGAEGCVSSGSEVNGFGLGRCRHQYTTHRFGNKALFARSHGAFLHKVGQRSGSSSLQQVIQIGLLILGVALQQPFVGL